MRIAIEDEPGVIADDTVLSRGGRYIDADKIRWVRGKPQLIGGWERLVRTPVEGICRTVYAWTDNSGQQNIAFGTHSHLMVWKGGAVFDITPVGLAPGQINGTGTVGYSTGAYGVGGYGQPSIVDYFPRTWSFGLLGEALVASPRGGGIYLWENNTAQPAAIIANAPEMVTSILVTPERIILALGCNEEASGDFNPRCIRNCDPRIDLGGTPGYEIWNTDTDTLAREKILEGAGRIVGGRGAGYGNFVWTDNEVFDCRYVGATDEIYSFSRLGEDCGLIGPNACCVRNQRAFWLTPDLQFTTVALGGEPTAIDSPMRDELRANLAPSQRDKITFSTLSSFSEVWCFYPDRRDGLENSRAMFFSTTDGWWSKARLARTAFTDAGPSDYPAGVDVAGNCYWHERGRSADGNAISWSLAAGPRFIDSGERSIFMRSFWPDFQDQVGAINLTITTRERPQAADVTHGPFTMAADTETVDLRVDGVLLSWAITGSSGPASFRLGTPVIEGRQGRATR